MSVDNTLSETNGSLPNHYYPDIVYTVEPAIQLTIRFLRILQWKKGYAHQSIILTLLWTFSWFHSTLLSYTIPIWITAYLYYYFNGQKATKETTTTAYEKLTVELKEIQIELSSILLSLDFQNQLRRQSLFVLEQRYSYQLISFTIFYALWIISVKSFGLDKIIWCLGCLILTWHSSLFKVIRYSYHRASFMFKQAETKETNTTFSATTNKSDHFDRFYHFVVIEHQRWWLHSGWTSLLFPNERPKWSDEYLSKVPPIDSFYLPPPTTNSKKVKISWEWINDQFEIDRNHNVDKDGWEYGNWDWTSWSTKSSGLLILTRRRHWVRNARLVEEIESDNASMTTTTAAIPILMKKTNTCASLSTSFSSEDSFCSTPTFPSLLQYQHKKSLSTTTTSIVEPSIFSSDDHSVESLWLRR